MILCIDIGNSCIKAAQFNAGTLSSRISFETSKGGNSQKIPDLLANLVKEKPEGIIYSSVVPDINQYIERVCTSLFETRPVRVSSLSKLNFTIRYDNPDQLGADRIATSAAAFDLYPGKDIIVIDGGTAITFCVLLSEGIFDGGVITAGVGTAMSSLSQKAAQLFSVDLSKPKKAAARSTESALQSGFYYGWVSLVNGIVDRLTAEYARDFTIVVTGGSVKPLLQDLNYTVFDEDLLFKGLNTLYILNR
jgi:type III pantothenate kinase